MLGILWMGLLTVGMVAGIYTVYQVFSVGFVVYAKTDILVWTLPLASYIFFSLTSAGLAFVSSLPLVFGLKRFAILEKRVLFLELSVLVASFICLFMHLGSPLKVFWLLLSPNLASPMWWLAMLYGLYLLALLAAFQAVYSGKSPRLLGSIVLLIAVGTSTALGWLMGMADGRPLLNPTYLTMYLPLTALACGLAIILLFSLVSTWVKGDELSSQQAALHDEIAKWFGIVTATVLIVFLWRIIINGFSSTGVEYAAFLHMRGQFSFHVELWVGLVVPLALLIMPGTRSSNTGRILAAGLFLVGMLVGRMEFILSAEVMPFGPLAEGNPQFVSYIPTIWEVLVTLFALSAMLLLYTLGERFLKLDDVAEV